MIPVEQASSGGVDAIRLAARSVSSSELEVELSVPDIRCAGCIQKIENVLKATPDISRARVNLTARHVRVRWKASSATPSLITIIESVGFKAQLADVDEQGADNNELAKHIRALAVAGFAAGNVMMLSWSVWSGADDSTRHLFHLLSAAIAIPALIFSSRVFFSSAWQALRHRTTNMDVPICVGIVLTTLLSLYDTMAGGHQVYFDAAIMLVFFLLIGRTLDTRMRAKARDAMISLKRMQPAIAHVLLPDGHTSVVTAVGDVRENDLLRVGIGERIPVDCCVVSGGSSIDMSIVSGESMPVSVGRGSMLYAGCNNLDGVLNVTAVQEVTGSFLSRIEREITQAESQKGRYQQLADKVVSYYTPFVHIAALVGFVAWMMVSRDWYQSITVGVAVLIITCPCALGLAVPIARVIAAQQLMRRGVLMKNGQALEQLALISTAVFDKTGTLTTAQASLNSSSSDFNNDSLDIAQSLSAASEHPYARAILNAEKSANTPEFSRCWDVINHIPGAGVEGCFGRHVYRLGSEAWSLPSCIAEQQTNPVVDNLSSSILSCDGRYLARFSFNDTLRQSASLCIRQLESLDIATAILSGDKQESVDSVAKSLNIKCYQAAAKPWDKVNWIQSAQQSGETVLMIGDGINDSPALSAAAVSMVPGTAANMTRRMGDFIILADRLTAIPEAIRIARQARRIMIQNLWLAVGYNIVAMPLAMTGHVTPLVAALAMSLSSALVVANSLRLTRVGVESEKQTFFARGRYGVAPNAVGQDTV